MPRAAAKNKTPEEAIGYALAHRVRIEILSALNERPYSAIQLSRIVRQSLSTVTHHVDELLKADRIEIAETKRVRNIDRTFYRAVTTPFLSDEEVEALPAEARQAIYGLIIQNSTAEALASLWAGKISEDPRSWLSWRWFNVDEQGRRDIADEQARSWARMQEIEAESAERRSPSRPIIVTSFGYERSREPVPADE